MPTYRPPELRLSIHQAGGNHRELVPARRKSDDAPFDFTGWTARLQIVDEHETTIVVYGTSGEDGVITLGTAGTVDLDLDDDIAAALPETVEVAGVIHAPCYGDFIFTSPAGRTYPKFRAVVEIVRSPEP